MSNSLSDQLLKAGLVTQNQIDQSEQNKQQQKARAKARSKDHKAGKHKNPGSSGNPNTSRKNTTPPKDATSAHATKKPVQREKKAGSDLAKFYQQRNQLEREERETEERLKREAAARRKKVRKQLRELIAEHSKNVEDASVRFNFVVGETVKYLYVTEEQQQAIADGKLSITFMDGKRCLIAPEIGEQILALDDSKIVINFKDDATADEQIPAGAPPEAPTDTDSSDKTVDG